MADSTDGGENREIEGARAFYHRSGLKDLSEDSTEKLVWFSEDVKYTKSSELQKFFFRIVELCSIMKREENHDDWAKLENLRWNIRKHVEEHTASPRDDLLPTAASSATDSIADDGTPKSDDKNLENHVDVVARKDQVEDGEYNSSSPIASERSQSPACLIIDDSGGEVEEPLKNVDDVAQVHGHDYYAIVNSMQSISSSDSSMIVEASEGHGASKGDGNDGCEDSSTSKKRSASSLDEDAFLMVSTSKRRRSSSSSRHTECEQSQDPPRGRSPSRSMPSSSADASERMSVSPSPPSFHSPSDETNVQWTRDGHMPIHEPPFHHPPFGPPSNAGIPPLQPPYDQMPFHHHPQRYPPNFDPPPFFESPFGSSYQPPHFDGSFGPAMGPLPHLFPPPRHCPFCNGHHPPENCCNYPTYSARARIVLERGLCRHCFLQHNEEFCAHKYEKCLMCGKHKTHMALCRKLKIR